MRERHLFLIRYGFYLRREEGREGGREGGREEGREGGRERGIGWMDTHTHMDVSTYHIVVDEGASYDLLEGNKDGVAWN